MDGNATYHSLTANTANLRLAFPVKIAGMTAYEVPNQRIWALGLKSGFARKRGRWRRHTLEHWSFFTVRFGKIGGRFRKQDVPASTQLVAIRRAVQIENLPALRQLIPRSKEEVSIRNSGGVLLSF